MRTASAPSSANYPILDPSAASNLLSSVSTCSAPYSQPASFDALSSNLLFLLVCRGQQPFCFTALCCFCCPVFCSSSCLCSVRSLLLLASRLSSMLYTVCCLCLLPLLSPIVDFIVYCRRCCCCSPRSQSSLVLHSPHDHCYYNPLLRLNLDSWSCPELSHNQLFVPAPLRHRSASLSLLVATFICLEAWVHLVMNSHSFPVAASHHAVATQVEPARMPAHDLPDCTLWSSVCTLFAHCCTHLSDWCLDCTSTARPCAPIQVAECCCAEYCCVAVAS